jgi:hypothetical protein
MAISNNVTQKQYFLIEEDIDNINEKKKYISENKNKIYVYTFYLTFVRERFKNERSDIFDEITNNLDLPIVLYDLIFDYYGIFCKFDVTMKSNCCTNYNSKIVLTCSVYDQRKISGFRLKLFTIDFYNDHIGRYIVHFTNDKYEDIKKVIYSLVTN